MHTLVAVGLLQALLAAYLLATRTTLWIVDTELAPYVATGTFPNRNHLAGPQGGETEAHIASRTTTVSCALTLAATVFLLWATYSARFGLADYLALRARGLVNDWEISGVPLSLGASRTPCRHCSSGRSPWRRRPRNAPGRKHWCEFLGLSGGPGDVAAAVAPFCAPVK